MIISRHAWFLPAPLVLALLFLTACAPSESYRQGRGFYSEQFTQAQVQAAAKAGKVTEAGNFSFESNSCGNYSTGLADDHLVHATLQEKLPELGANAAEHIGATEQLRYFLLSLILLPMGCSDWTISGHALLVDVPPPSAPPQPH
ncbi:MAG: hypothetical protein EPO64_01290 [Nitrospirae bacterium]|nr:MAG: hypothetical protein EPO64_01290 [Nitrospirota bacterium]